MATCALILFVMPCTAQINSSDSSYCMPISKARLVFADAIKKRVLDSLLVNNAKEVKLCMDAKDSQSKAYLAAMANLNQQVKLQSEINENSTGIIGTYKKETDYYKKQSRRHRNERNVMILVFVWSIAALILQ